MSDATTAPASGATRPALPQKLAAEALGTAVLVFIGCGSAVVAGGGDITSIGLSFGIAVVVMAYAFGRISGGHFNPAVSVGAALSGRLSWKDAGLYTAAQVVGGLVGGLLLALVLLASDIGWEFGDGMGSNGFGDHGGVELLGALLIEIILTFIFLMVILGVTDERNDTVAFAPLAIGLTLAAIHFVAIPATGTSVNPARSIGVAFESGGDAIAQLWLFIVAPLIGAAIAGFLYPLLFGRGADPVPGSFGAARQAMAVPGFGAPDQFQQQWNQPGGQAAAHQPAQPATHQGAAQPGQAGEQPIIQDGWQWDPVAQQWIPAQQGYGGDAGTQVRPPQ
ncbi:MAG TPA: MIP family channel protein [Nocardioides sp.]|nr:MIP family channel protein [Nocardioides sp.]